MFQLTNIAVPLVVFGRNILKKCTHADYNKTCLKYVNTAVFYILFNAVYINLWTPGYRHHGSWGFVNLWTPGYQHAVPLVVFGRNIFKKCTHAD
jgi:hypothetical protein